MSEQEEKMTFYTDKSLDSIKQLLSDESADMPELRKNLTNSLIQMVEERDEQIKRLKQREETRYRISQWLEDNSWLGETCKMCFQITIAGFCAIVICVVGVGLSIYTVNKINGTEQCQCGR